MTLPLNHREPGLTPVPSSQTAGGPAAPALGPSATFPCPECDGVGFFVSRAFHPDDPRCEATWDCDECGGTGEVDYETPEYRGPSMTMEQVLDRIARVFLGVAR